MTSLHEVQHEARVSHTSLQHTAKQQVNDRILKLLTDRFSLNRFKKQLCRYMMVHLYMNVVYATGTVVIWKVKTVNKC